MATPYVTRVNDNVNNGFSLQFSNSSFDTTLAANTEQTLAVPLSSGLGAASSSKNRFVAIFKVQDGKTVWVANNATATVAGLAFDATASQMIISGDGRDVAAGDVLHFITADTTAIVGVSFYSVNS